MTAVSEEHGFGGTRKGRSSQANLRQVQVPMAYPFQREALGSGFLVAAAEAVSGSEAVSLGKQLALAGP